MTSRDWSVFPGVEARGARVYRVRIPLLEPFRISNGTVAVKEAVLVRLEDGKTWGWGESSAMGGGFYSDETPQECWEQITRVLLPAVLGNRFETIAALDGLLRELTPNRFATVAIESAAWELAARSLGVAVDELLGIAPRAVPSGLAVGLYGSADELLAAIARLGVERYSRLKIKIQRGQDLELVAAVRQKYGAIPLFVDANGDYSEADIPLFEQMDRYNLMMFEQPFAKHDLETAAALQARVRTPVCLDESIVCAETAGQAIRMGACRVVNLKLQRVGGISEGLRIIDECGRTATPLWMGTMPELGIGSAQALALAMHPAFTLPTDVEPSSRWYVDDVLAPPLRLADGGTIQLPPGSGWRYEVDAARLAKYCVEETGF